MSVVAAVSILFGLVLLAGAHAAVDIDEVEVGLIGAACGTVFVLAGLNAWPA